MGIHAQLLGKIALGHGAEHLLGGLGGGQIVDVEGELPLQEPHPAGAAAGEHGPGVAVAVGKAVDELAALLHDGQVGGEVGVEHVVEAQHFQRGHHPLGGGIFGREMVVLSPGGADGGSHLHHGDLVGISQGGEDLAGVVPLLQATHGAVGDALAAEGAVGLGQGAGPGDAHGGAGAGAHNVPDAHALDLVADLDAAHALDAAVLQADHRIAQVVGGVAQVLDVVLAQQVVVVAQLLELAVAAAGALGALDVVLAQQQVQVHPAGLTDTGRVGVDHHALPHHVVAGGDQALLAVHLHHADAAGADLVDVVQIAESGDLDPVGAGRLQNGGAVGHGDGFVVDGQRYHFVLLPPLKMPYPKWSQRRQRDASVQAPSQVRPISMPSKSCLRSPASRSVVLTRP